MPGPIVSPKEIWAEPKLFGHGTKCKIIQQNGIIWSSPKKLNQSKIILDLQKDKALILIGMREVTFIPLSFLDLTLSPEFLSKFPKNLEVKIDIGLIWDPAKLIETYKRCP